MLAQSRREEGDARGETDKRGVDRETGDRDRGTVDRDADRERRMQRRAGRGGDRRLESTGQSEKQGRESLQREMASSAFHPWSSGPSPLLPAF